MVRVLKTHIEEFPLRTFGENMREECSEIRNKYVKIYIILFYVLKDKIKIIINEILHVLNE